MNMRAQIHAYVAVDVAVFTIDAGELKLLLVKVRGGPFAGQWALPGGRVDVAESLEDAALRELATQTGLADIYLEQLGTFGDVDRDPRARVVSTAYFALIRRSDGSDGSVRSDRSVGSKYSSADWFTAHRSPPLAYDHDRVAAAALARLRSKLEYTNIVYGLLPREFTVGELQGIYEIILGRELDRRNFRKKILATGLLRERPGVRRGAGRPAALFSFVKRKPMVVEML